MVNSDGVHQVLDISHGGLYFRCMAGDDFPTEWAADIIVPDTQICLEKIPVELIQERNDFLPSFISMPTKKMGIKFLSLNDNNRFLLTQLISYLDGGLTH